MRHRHTPWGISQVCERFADGMELHSTAGHGGVWIDWLRTKQIRKAWPDAFGSVIGSGIDHDRDGSSWWEEDCAISFVMAMWPQAFADRRNERQGASWTADQVELSALQSVRRWAPQALRLKDKARLEWLEAEYVEVSK